MGYSFTYGQSNWSNPIVFIYDSCQNDTLMYSFYGSVQVNPMINDSMLVFKEIYGSSEEIDTILLTTNRSFVVNRFAKVGVTNYVFYALNKLTNQVEDSVIFTKSNLRTNCRSIEIFPFTDFNNNCTYDTLDFLQYGTINIYKNNLLVGTKNNTTAYWKTLKFSAQDYNAMDTIKIIAVNGISPCAPSTTYEFILDTMANFQTIIIYRSNVVLEKILMFQLILYIEMYLL